MSNTSLNKTKSEEHSTFLNHLLSGDRFNSSLYAKEFLKNHTVEELYEQVLKKALYRIGELWEYNQISVATEHLASAIVESILNELYPDICSASEKLPQKAVVACVVNEYHQIGIKMISDVFEMNGWNTYYLGANTPTRELIDFIKMVKPDLLAISMSIYFHLPELLKMLQQIRAQFEELPILVGGQAFLHGVYKKLNGFNSIHYLADLKDTETFIKNFSKHG